jgi:hypothetical protein
MPMDELIGLRGPVSALLRNLLWLLASNAAYTGIFGCIPYVIGRFWYSRLSAFSRIVEASTFLFQKVFFSLFVFDETLGPQLNATDVLLKLNATSHKSEIMLKPSDVASMTLGYFSLALSMFIIKISLKTYRHDIYHGLIKTLQFLLLIKAKIMVPAQTLFAQTWPIAVKEEWMISTDEIWDKSKSKT